MIVVTEKNLSKVIIYSFIVLMSFMVFAISYFYIENTYSDFEKQINNFKYEYYENKKNILKRDVSTIIDVINYNFAKENILEEESKLDAIRLLNNIRFEKKRSNYYFVYEIKNINGGKNFAKLLVNPNRKDLVGKFISTDYKDPNGKKFRKEFLSQIKKNGETFSEYSYLKPSSKKIVQKLSYFKLYEPWNWVIAVGVYLDDIEKEIFLKKSALEKRVKSQITQNIILFMMFLLIAILISLSISKNIDDILEKYHQKVLKNQNKLKELNQNLEKKVAYEIEKNREKEQFLIQKSKFISLGEMISNIAHQWRQPLCELSSILMFIKFKYSINSLDKKIMNKKTKEAEEVIEFMSQTIEDFKTFFLPKKEKEEFFLSQTVDIVINIVSSILEENSIKIIKNIDEKIKLNGYLNQYEQVLLNIINNAKDTLVQNSVKKPIIKIKAFEEKGLIKVFIEDNAGGIVTEPIEKIFEPYFTTKCENDGIGIGLYMSKIIIEKNMKGTLDVKNIKKGARFIISTPK